MSRFVHGSYLPAHLSRADALWLVFQSGRLLVSTDPAQPLFPETRDIGWFGFAPATRHFVGTWDDKPVFAHAAGPDEPAPEGYFFEDMRKLLAGVDLEQFWMAGRASQLLEWDRTHRFCGCCGTRTEFHATERAIACPSCGHLAYPRINPCVIVVITRGEELLLARSVRFNRPMYSALAGFVEAGETAEDTLRREVMEEVGLKVKNIRYFGSQPWPFPGNLMLGYHAEYESGDIVLQDDEIADAQFFHPSKLPQTPPPGSIAHALIQAAIKQVSQV